MTTHTCNRFNWFLCALVLSTMFNVICLGYMTYAIVDNINKAEYHTDYCDKRTCDIFVLLINILGIFLSLVTITIYFCYINKLVTNYQIMNTHSMDRKSEQSDKTNLIIS